MLQHHAEERTDTCRSGSDNQDCIIFSDLADAGCPRSPALSRLSVPKFEVSLFLSMRIYFFLLTIQSEKSCIFGGVKRIIVILLFCLSFLACDKHELCDVVSQQAVSVMETGYVSAPQTNYIFGVESSNILSVRTTPECQRTFRTFRNNDCLFRNGKCINPRIFDFSIGEMISGWTGKLSLDRFIYSICFLRL